MKVTYTKHTKEAVSLLLLMTVMVFLAVGCSEDSASNPVSPLSSTFAVDVTGDALAKLPEPIDGMAVDPGKYCQEKQIGYVELANDLRCDAVTVEIDGEFYMTLEPGAAIVTYLFAQPHMIDFKKYKQERVFRSEKVLVEVCELVRVSTGRDVCAEAMK